MEASSRTAAATQARRDTSLPDGCAGLHPDDDDDGVEERLTETAGWEDAIAVMMVPAESSLRSCTSTASMKVKNIRRLPVTKGHFPTLAECAHFHYEYVDFGSVQLCLTEDENDLTHIDQDPKELVYLVQICCQGRSWMVRRSYEEFRVLDKHLHLCIYDRRFSQLPELPRIDSLKENSETLSQMLTAYISRLSAIADNKINCGPALTWMEIDNKGNHLLVRNESSINVPAVAAAHVVKRYSAQAADELSFEVGDIVSVIDMPPKEDTGWWRGKRGFQVGFFPSDCVELISEKSPSNVTSSLTKPVSRKHGKLITFLRTFMKSRPSKQKLKQRGILRERVFGCDLGEHLLNSGHDVPQVIRSCTEFIERNGVVDGIYRLSGISSNIQKLRHEFDSEHVPDLTKDTYVQDIHSVGSLCKLYFRELPNPLLTYQLYEKFSDAVSAATDDERLVKVHDVIQQLPPPHYRTLEFLMRHLSRMGTYSAITNMHCKNLAIVWAPNLLRSKQIESACFSGTSAFMEVRVQSVVVEFMLNHVEVLFSPKLSTLIRHGTGHTTSARPKSLLVSSPSTKLLSLEEAQARTQAQLVSPVSPDSRYIDVGEGPAALRGKFHTVIDFPAERKKASTKVKRSPVGNWLSFFNVRPKLRRHPSEPNETRTPALPGGRGDAGTLRSAKSEESLSQAFEGGFNLYRPRRPLSTSDALSVSFNEDLLNSRMTADSQSSLKDLKKHTISPALMVLAHPAGDVASVNIEPRAFHSTQMTEHTEDEGKKRGSSKSGGSVGENKTLEKVPRPPDLIPMDPDGADPAAPDQLETGTSTDGQLVSTRNLVQKTGAVGRPSDIGPLMNKPTATSNRDEGHRRSASFCKAESKPANAKEHRRTNSGAVTFECTPGLVRSVSLITPHPAVKSAARLLALELAESAQKASLISKRGSSEPPTPVSPRHHLNQLLSGREEQYIATKIIPGPSSTMSTESHTETGSPRSTCACHGSESGLSFSEGCDAPYYNQSTPHKNSEKWPSLDNHSSVKDNIRHVGVGTERGIHGDGLVKCAGVSQPFTESLLKHTSSDGHSAINSLHDKQATAANFQAMLADAAMPDAFPPPSIAAYQYKAKEQSSAYLQHASGPDEPNVSYYHQDVLPHSRVLLRNYCNSLASRAIHQSMKYRGQRDEFSTAGQRYPPLDGASVYPTIRRVRSMHTPPEDKFCFSQHRGSRNKPFPKLPPSEIQQVRPYFEDGKVRYRYSPYSEAPYNKTDQYRDNTPGYVLSYTLNRLPLQSLKVSDSAENFHKPHHKVSVSKESEFLPRTNSRPLCESLNSSFSEKHYNPSHRRDNSGKSRHLGSLAPQPHFETFRSRSNSGKEMLISTEGADGKYRVTMVSHYSPEHQHPEPDSAVSYRSDRHGRGQRAKSALKLKQSQSMHNYPQHGLDSTAPSRNPTLQKEYSCPDFKHTGLSEGFGLALHSSDKPVRTTHRKSKEDYQYIWAMSRDPLRSRRSQSVRTRHSPQPAKRTLERDHRLSFPSQSRTRTRSMYVPSRSDHSESRTGSNVFPKYGCIPPHRLFSAALHHAELRPEMQIYGE